MSRILAIDLGKFMSVTCLLDTTTHETEFWTMSTDRPYWKAVLQRDKPDLVVIEAGTIAGWVHDVCTSKGQQVLIGNPNQEAWKGKHIQRQTDRDEALQIAKLAAWDQLIPVYLPSERQREYRRLVKYGTVVRGRLVRLKNKIRAIFQRRGRSMVSGRNG
jgi:transposase